MFYIQHCFICRLSDYNVSENTGIEPRTVYATSALAVRRSIHSARSHSQTTLLTHRSPTPNKHLIPWIRDNLGLEGEVDFSTEKQQLGSVPSVQRHRVDPRGRDTLRYAGMWRAGTQCGKVAKEQRRRKYFLSYLY
jgi:hypothetical protein